MPLLDRMQTGRARKAAANMGKRGSSRLFPSDGRLGRLGRLFGWREPHCTEGNEESAAYLLLAPVIDGNRRRIGESGSGRFDLSGTTLPLRAGAFFRRR